MCIVSETVVFSSFLIPWFCKRKVAKPRALIVQWLIIFGRQVLIKKSFNLFAAMPRSSLQFLYPVVGVLIAGYLGAEHAFRLSATASWAKEPLWRNWVAARQPALRLIPDGLFVQAMGFFTSATTLDLTIYNENQAAAIGLQMRSLPVQLRRVIYTLDVRSLVPSTHRL